MRFNTARQGHMLATACGFLLPRDGLAASSGEDATALSGGFRDGCGFDDKVVM